MKTESYAPSANLRNADLKHLGKVQVSVLSDPCYELHPLNGFLCPYIKEPFVSTEKITLLLITVSNEEQGEYISDTETKRLSSIKQITAA